MKQLITKRKRIGNRYENYIAWLLKRDGWEVDARGSYGVYDRGVDLIATKGETKRYIQCKGWSVRRTIHEDVVSQLYGSVASLEGPSNISCVEMYIYSPARPSAYAVDKASNLGIKFERIMFPIWNRYRRHYRP